MKSFSILLVAVSLLGVSCERHEFDGPNGTKQLHEHHTAGAAHADAAHEEAGHDGADHEDSKDAHKAEH